jgi:hypothetical protein
MSTLESTLRLAKRGSLSRAELYARMLAASKVFQTVGVSDAQAFAAFCNTDEGCQLLAIEKSLPGQDVAPAWQAPITKKESGGSLWDNLVNATAKSQNISYSKAVDVCLSTPEGKAIFRDQRRDELVNKSGCTFADLECFDRIEKARGDDVPGVSPPSDYEQAVNNLLQQHPYLTRSEAMDEARKANPQAWEEHKAMDKLGGRTLPHGHQTSGVNPPSPTSQRESTPRPPMWQSDHSGNRPGTTPVRTPYSPSGEPRIKGWFERSTPTAQAWYVNELAKIAHLSRDSATQILKRL